MKNKFYTWCERNTPVLLREKTPVWLTIVFSLIAAVAAYWISPVINRQFEIDAARGAHLTATTQGLNSEIITLSEKIRRLNNAFVDDPSLAQKLREDCLDVITELQWRLVDLDIVLKTAQDREAVASLGTSIEKVREVLAISTDKSTETQRRAAMAQLAKRTTDVLDRLYVASSLK